MSTNTNRTAAIGHLIEKWDANIAAGEVSTEDTIDAMLGQIQKNFQGWDISAEELDEEAQAAMGWEDEDIDWDVWESVVSEAARKWLAKYEMRKAIADNGYDSYFFTDVAFAITEGSDYDEKCQEVTDQIAEDMGIAQPAEYEDWDGTEYGLVNEIVNEMVTAAMTDE